MQSRSVRAAEPGDVAACVGLALGASVDERAAAGSAFWHGALTHDIDDPTRALLVAMSDEAVVGYARARFVEPETDAPGDRVPEGYYLLGLFVAPAHRRLGLGSALTSGRLEWIRERADEAWFFSNARNVASIELHRRFGFAEVTRRFSFPGLVFEGGEGILFRLGF
jgi:ribosomal protein S18 acetylase RimI-like enzyme